MDEMKNNSLGNKPENRRKRTTPLGLNPIDIGGRVPPQALDVEEAVSGAILIEKNALSAVIDQLKPEVFYIRMHIRRSIRLFNDCFTRASLLIL